MKSNFFLPGKLLIIVLLLAACGTAPTANSTPTSISSPTAVMATITFENNECTYDGPQPIPAGPSITVNWVIKNKDRTKYGLYVFTLNEGKTRENLMAAANDPTPPSWAPIAGSAESTPNNSRQMTVNTQNGPLYFTCWFSPPDTMFQIIGPIKVSGTNP